MVEFLQYCISSGERVSTCIRAKTSIIEGDLNKVKANAMNKMRLMMGGIKNNKK